MRAFLAYGLASAAVLAAMGAGVVGLVGSADAAAVRLAALMVWPVQLGAFAALVRGREGMGFMAAWAIGMALRFAVVGAAAFWVTRVEGPDPASLLVSMVGFVFVLVLLEPLFLRLTTD